MYASVSTCTGGGGEKKAFARFRYFHIGVAATFHFSDDFFALHCVDVFMCIKCLFSTIFSIESTKPWKNIQSTSPFNFQIIALVWSIKTPSHTTMDEPAIPLQTQISMTTDSTKQISFIQLVFFFFLFFRTRWLLLSVRVSGRERILPHSSCRFNEVSTNSILASEKRLLEAGTMCKKACVSDN